MTGLNNISWQWFKTLLDLSKFKISLLTSLSTATGFILTASRLSIEIIITVFGIFLLACGSSALNHYQDREIDALMNRTKLRPIPSGKIKPINVLYMSLLLIFLGFVALFYSMNLTVFGLGIVAILWYNGFYTLLKRKIVFAVVPGALIGAVPPTVGWVSGGGNIFEPQIWVIAFFFFIWQMTHFWLIILNYGEDYEKAGIPSPIRIFTTEQLIRITFIWILAAAVNCFLIPIFNIINSHLINFSLISIVLWLVWNAIKLLRIQDRKIVFNLALRKINIYLIWVISVVSIGKLLKFI